MKLYFDLETIPTQQQIFIDEIANTITHPKTMSKPETIAAWEKDKKPLAIDEAVSKTVFDGGMGEIITFGYAFNDDEPEVIQRNKDISENDLLSSVNDLFNDKCIINNASTHPVWIGHNICGYDLRYLWKRFIVNGIKPAIKIPFDAKPWASEVYDTMFEWAGTGNDKKSMDFVCKALGLEGKTGMDGSMVYQAWLDEKYNEIAEYCKHDIEMTRSIYKRINFIY